MSCHRWPLVAFTLLAGCSSVGDFQRPDTYLPEKWKYGESLEGAAKATDVSWRTMFRDPRLQQLITDALKYNSDLKMALARLSEVRSQYSIVSADRLPTAGLSGSKTMSKIPAAFTGTDRPVTTERAELALTAVSFELDFWGRVANLSDAAKASFLASEATSRALRISLISEVANQYFTLLELDERLLILNAAIESRTKNRDLIRRAVELGAAARSDYLMAEAALNTVQGESASLSNQRESTELSLRSLVGKPLDSLPPGISLYGQDVRNDLVPGIPSEVLYARPDVIAAENRLRESQANIRAARAAFLPRILLTVGIGLASPTLAKLFAPGTDNWSFQPTFSLPIFDGGKTEGYANIAEARKNSAVADYERTIQQAFREVSSLLSSRTTLAAQRQATEGVVQAYEERLIVAEVRFKAGSASYIEVLDAQRDVYNSRQTAVQIRRSQLSNSAQLYKALGGGGITSEDQSG